MGESRRGTREQVNVFEVDERYLFRHYFDGDEVFDRLQQYYNHQQYRFEVPLEEFDEIQSFLAARGYDLEPVTAVSKFVVVVEKYTAHPENIFKSSVILRSVDGYNCFLVTDQFSVAEAVNDGATRLTDTSLENPF